MELGDPLLPWATDPSPWSQKPPALGLPTESSFTLVPNSPAAEHPDFPSLQMGPWKRMPPCLPHITTCLPLASPSSKLREQVLC